MSQTTQFHGRWSYRLRSLLNLVRCIVKVAVRRMVRGRRLDWPFTFELGTEFLRSQGRISFDMPTAADAREYEDAVVVTMPEAGQVTVELVNEPVKGEWITPKADIGDVVVLYLHGGAYVYFSKGHVSLIAQAALAARARVFALDYRLAPEHPYPAQLEDALAAYLWLLESGVSPDRLVVMGDSAGGNLALALLLKLRDLNLPLPAGAVPLCPWTDPGNTVSPVEEMAKNDAYDWPQSRMVLRWGRWLCGQTPANDPLIAPIHADLRGLPPIYIQAGGVEILYDQIVRFVERARAQGADVTLDVWPTMNHDFQAYGDQLPQSREAWQRIRAFVAEVAVEAEATQGLVAGTV
jgi:acetyl esterase/lipase